MSKREEEHYQNQDNAELGESIQKENSIDDQLEGFSNYDPNAKFPEVGLHFKSCPNCGCKDTIASLSLQAEHDAGRCKSQNAAWLHQINSLVASQVPGLMARLTTSFLDACVECGTVYVTRAVSQMVPDPRTEAMRRQMKGPGDLRIG